MRRWGPRGSVAAMLVVAGVVAIGCGGDDDSESGGQGVGGSLNVAIVDNPQMKDIANLTPSLFTKKSGTKVNYTILEEGTLRQVTTRDVAAGGRQFDVVMIGRSMRRSSVGTATSPISRALPPTTRRTSSRT